MAFSTSLGRILSLHDFEEAARRRLPYSLFNYIQGGCEDDVSVQENRRAFDRWRLVPRALVDITTRTQHTELWGQRYASPFGIAPMGSAALFAYRGDLALAQAARQAQIPMVLSGASLIRMEEVAAAYPGAWFQAYVPGSENDIASLLRRVQEAGFKTLVLTVDTPASANRESNIRAGFSTPLRPTFRLGWQGVMHPRWSLSTFMRTLARHGLPYFENASAQRGVAVLSRQAERAFADRGGLSWAHLRLVRRLWKDRLVLKGVLHLDDALAARQHGCDGIVVSNHGGRQLDNSIDPMAMLPSIVDACPDMAVMTDSGIRRGTDVVKALALGARMVFVGRPMLYAATVAGASGVLHAIELLQTEISRDMAMLGATAITSLSRTAHLHAVHQPLHGT
jgi:L-lactate dehydrogenase (cytochrome)